MSHFALVEAHRHDLTIAGDHCPYTFPAWRLLTFSCRLNGQPHESQIFFSLHLSSEVIANGMSSHNVGCEGRSSGSSPSHLRTPLCPAPGRFPLDEVILLQLKL